MTSLLLRLNRLAVQGSTFRVDKLLTSFYLKDIFFSVFIKPFHPNGVVGYFEYRSI